MKKLFFFLLATSFVLASCETSEGLKFGVLQKVSHKTFPCPYYEIQVAYQGGKSSNYTDHASYSNTQEIKIDKDAYDSLQNYVGEEVVFDYKDNGFAVCGSSKELTSIRLKNKPVIVTTVPAKDPDTTTYRVPSVEEWEAGKIPKN